MCCPRGGSAPLRDIDRLAIQQWVAEKFGKATGWQTVRNSWVLLSSILEIGGRIRLSADEPGAGREVPAEGAEGEAGDDRRGELRRSCSTQLSEPHRTMVSLIAATGLRIGELLALRWSALDLEIGTLAVRESVFEGKFQAPKTQRALRTIPLGPHAVAGAHRASRRLVSAASRAISVFGNRKGEPLRESKMLTKVLQPAAEAAGLGRVTWHQFRHIHSSLLNDLKVPAKIAQEQLGHASISTTLSIYTHVVDASHREAVEAVEERLFGVLLRMDSESAAALESAPPASDSVN